MHYKPSSRKHAFVSLARKQLLSRHNIPHIPTVRSLFPSNQTQFVLVLFSSSQGEGTRRDNFPKHLQRRIIPNRCACCAHRDQKPANPFLQSKKFSILFFNKTHAWFPIVLTSTRPLNDSCLTQSCCKIGQVHDKAADLIAPYHRLYVPGDGFTSCCHSLRNNECHNSSCSMRSLHNRLTRQHRPSSSGDKCASTRSSTCTSCNAIDATATTPKTPSSTAGGAVGGRGGGGGRCKGGAE
jgi:hypothetical protein